MPLFIKSLIATICILSILIYDFMCLCRIIGKEKWVEKIYNSLVTKLEYNEDIVFRLIRPLFLTTSFMMFLLIPEELTRIPYFNIILAPTTLFAAGASLKGMKPKKDDDDNNKE